MRVTTEQMNVSVAAFELSHQVNEPDENQRSAGNMSRGVKTEARQFIGAFCEVAARLLSQRLN